jgi:hypothetical protein
MTPLALCGLLAEPERLRVFASVVLGAQSPSEVEQATGLNAQDVVRALRRLAHGGVVQTVNGRLRAGSAVFKEAVRGSGEGGAGDPVPLDPDREKAAVLRAFLSGGRLRQMPAARGKRRIVLEHIAASFEPGVRYPERAINAVLRAWFDDYVTLRRYLIDEELMARGDGVYWRIGGYVDVSSAPPAASSSTSDSQSSSTPARDSISRR